MYRLFAFALLLTFATLPACAATPTDKAKPKASSSQTLKAPAKAANKSPAKTPAKATPKAAAAAAPAAAEPAKAASATGGGLANMAFSALDRGQISQAMALADRIGDPVLADTVRGEAYANGAAAPASEIFAFLARHSDWPQRSAIMAAAENQLSDGVPYEPLLKVYTVDSQPVTTQGFNTWIATLKANGRDSDARAAIRVRWQKAKLAAGQEDDFRYRYGGYLTSEDNELHDNAVDEGGGIQWKTVHIQIRDQLAQKHWRDAYALAAGHSLKSGANASDYSAAEFLAGWLSLRHLNQPQRALVHFQRLYDSVKTPVSKSRGAYWLGRTYEAMGDRASARRWYEEGATFPTCFYGQLSAAKLDPDGPLKLPPEPPVPASVRSAFEKQALPHAVRSLAAIGQEDRAVRFLKALAASADTRAEFVLTDDLARTLNRPNLEVIVAKAANQKNYILGQRGFPLLASARGEHPETALALGIIRQESEFRSDAQSQAGAMGLMQLMPNTAKGLATRAGVSFNPRELLQPNYNVKLGREYLGDRIDEFSGSYILAIAAYNAGRGRVREWLDIYGDPRSPKVDPIDWIETLPVYETRNYVQRVLENTNVYRSRLADVAKAPQPQLGIVQDLTR